MDPMMQVSITYFLTRDSNLKKMLTLIKIAGFSWKVRRFIQHFVTANLLESQNGTLLFVIYSHNKYAYIHIYMFMQHHNDRIIDRRTMIKSQE